MHKNLLPWQVLTLVALLAPSVYLAYIWPALPAQIPTHFSAAGQANGYTSRANMWLLTLALPLGVGLLMTVLPRLDPKRRLASDSINFQKLRLALVAMLSSLASYSLYAAVHPGAMSGRGIIVLVGLFFAFMGNYLTTVQPNYFVGIRTPWTLENPAVWARTHRVGGILFCITGLLMAGLALVLPVAWLSTTLLALVLSTAAFCYAYSYVIFRQQETLDKAV
jgi:uncharacterized membrane protein